MKYNYDNLRAGEFLVCVESGPGLETVFTPYSEYEVVEVIAVKYPSGDDILVTMRCNCDRAENGWWSATGYELGEGKMGKFVLLSSLTDKEIFLLRMTGKLP